MRLGTAADSRAALGPITPERLRRAFGLMAEPLGGEERWLVTGGQSPHVVTLVPAPDCGCRDYLARRAQCKHILAVRLAVLAPEMRTALRVLVTG